MALSNDELTNIAFRISDRFEKVNIFYLSKMAEQIKDIGKLNKSNMHRLEQMAKMGNNIEEINLYLSKQSGLALQDIYINKIAEVTGFEKIRIDSLKQIYSKLRVKSIIKAKPKIYIIRNDDQYIKTPKLWTSIVNGKVCKDNIIIMLYNTLL